AHMRIATGIWIYKEINEKNSLFDVQDDVKRYEHQKLSFVAITAGVSYRLYESFFITFSTAYVSGNIDVSTYNRTVMTAEYRNIMVLAGINMNF
ncbi:MAG: hypothetical protein N2316_10640, partial [Spirochaetes bacterium]|nr:hypothetical protein [Spirochaetota bacterium]